MTLHEAELLCSIVLNLILSATLLSKESKYADVALSAQREGVKQGRETMKETINYGVEYLKDLQKKEADNENITNTSPDD